jgi:hypothetical protein
MQTFNRPRNKLPHIDDEVSERKTAIFLLLLSQYLHMCKQKATIDNRVDEMVITQHKVALHETNDGFVKNSAVICQILDIWSKIELFRM